MPGENNTVAPSGETQESEVQSGQGSTSEGENKDGKGGGEDKKNKKEKGKDGDDQQNSGSSGELQMAGAAIGKALGRWRWICHRGLV